METLSTNYSGESILKCSVFFRSEIETEGVIYVSESTATAQIKIKEISAPQEYSVCTTEWSETITPVKLSTSFDVTQEVNFSLFPLFDTFDRRTRL